jgi:hypothetical protein
VQALTGAFTRASQQLRVCLMQPREKRVFGNRNVEAFYRVAARPPRAFDVKSPVLGAALQQGAMQFAPNPVGDAIIAFSIP